MASERGRTRQIDADHHVRRREAVQIRTISSPAMAGDGQIKAATAEAISASREPKGGLGLGHSEKTTRLDCLNRLEEDYDNNEGAEIIGYEEPDLSGGSPQFAAAPQEAPVLPHATVVPDAPVVVDGASAPTAQQLANLITVRLTQDNYLYWCAQILPLLRSRLDGYVDGSCPPRSVAAFLADGTRVKTLSDTLTSIGQPLRDEEFTEYILHGLDSDYDNLVEHVNGRETPIKQLLWVYFMGVPSTVPRSGKPGWPRW
ncbi:hypothetical protein QYE76_033082 [Lolium multiflorum]|uniref:Retrotransposon Copia-like N-terminal domain-containing protein n=1 Tax=Lolium multiflorum TaxID=4521 RepID=A0AAD8VJZ8_LOLMU|nr:hypothetical protein QYE76_033082 [Lolium multiflorum]